MATQEGATPEEVFEQKLDALFTPVTEAEEEKAQEEVPEETPGDEPEPEGEPEGEEETSDEDEEKPEEEAEQESITLTDLSAALGVDEDDLVIVDGKAHLKTKIDGEEGTASLADIRKSYQLEGHLNKQNMEVVEQRKAIEAERETFTQERQSKIQQLEDVLSLAASELTREFQSVDWDTLKQTDPQQYTLLRQEYQDREKSLGQSWQQLIEHRKEEAEKQQESFNQYLQSEYTKMRSSIPGWDDDAKFNQGRTEIQKGLTDYGYTEKEISAAADHRFVKLAHDAIEYRKLQAAKPEVLKKIKQAPKIVKPGTTQTPDKKTTSITKALDTMKKSGGEKGVLDYLAAKGF